MTSTRQMVVMLLVVAFVCSIILSFVYSFTSPRITETQKKMTLDGLKQVIDAYEFVDVIPDTLWNAVDSSGNTIGIVFRVFPQGYGGAIPITVGLDTDERITGIRIASAAEGLKETPGLGVKITEPDFTQQFAGKHGSQIKIIKDGGEIDAITAATISSRAVCTGIRKGIETYFCYLTLQYDKDCLFSEADFIEVIKDTLWYAIKDNDTIGIVFTGVAHGYVDDITFIVGVNKDAQITGVDILSSNETEGYGTLILNREFLDQFTHGTPEAITGATTSSQALINAVMDGLTRFKEYLK
jgi:electron transport complex protein RnfG